MLIPTLHPDDIVVMDNLPAHKIAAVRALCVLTRTPAPAEVLAAYGKKSLSFGADYIIPNFLCRTALLPMLLLLL